MSDLQIERMRELPLLIQRARGSREKLRLSRELRMLTEQYKQVRQSATRRREVPPEFVRAS